MRRAIAAAALAVLAGCGGGEESPADRESQAIPVLEQRIGVLEAKARTGTLTAGEGADLTVYRDRLKRMRQAEDGMRRLREMGAD